MCTHTYTHTHRKIERERREEEREGAGGEKRRERRKEWSRERRRERRRERWREERRKESFYPDYRLCPSDEDYNPSVCMCKYGVCVVCCTNVRFVCSKCVCVLNQKLYLG